MEEIIKKKNIYMYIYVCVTESCCCTPETNTTLYVNQLYKKYIAIQVF